MRTFYNFLFFSEVCVCVVEGGKVKYSGSLIIACGIGEKRETDEILSVNMAGRHGK